MTRFNAAEKPSMGPQLVRCGKPVRVSSLFASPFLQWGRNLFVAERHGQRDCKCRHDLPSMGPQLVRCGKREAAAIGTQVHVLLQWGRNLFVAESNAV